MPSPAPLCPACEYDLSGIVESWHGACPLRGRCPECGGEIDWGGVLRPRGPAPAWSFEHGPGMRRAALTLMRLTEPVSFWHALRHARVSRPGRIVPLIGATGAIGLVVNFLSVAWGDRVPGSAPRRLARAHELVLESYGDALEPLIYLSIWLAASVAGVAPFRHRARGFGRGALAGGLYGCAGLALAWSLLGTAGMLDAHFLMAFGVSTQIGSGLLGIVVLAAWVWLIAEWYGAVRWRVPVRRPLIAWLVSQVCASGAILAFGFIDAYLPF